MLERDSAALSPAPRRRRAAARRPRARGGGQTRCAAPARASCTPTTSTRRSAGARSRPRARPAPASSCTCTTTGSSARSAPASRAGEDCTRCHGRDTLPGVALNCRGGSLAESAAYAASLSLWQAPHRRAGRPLPRPQRVRAAAAAAARRAGRRPRVGAVVRPARVRRRRRGPPRGRHVLYAGRLSHEKGVADADRRLPRGRPAARRGRRGPGRGRAARARRGRRRALHRPRRPGAAGRAAPRRRRRGRALALRRDPAAGGARGDGGGLPVVASRSGGLAELVPAEGLFPPADVDALAARARRLWGDAAAGERALAVVRERTAPAVVARCARARRTAERPRVGAPCARS